MKLACRTRSVHCLGFGFLLLIHSREICPSCGGRGSQPCQSTCPFSGVQFTDDIGVKQAAAQLGIPYWTLADWRAARKAKGSQAFVGSGHKRLPTDEKERRILELEKENADLKRANEILKDALGFFAESRRK